MRVFRTWGQSRMHPNVCSDTETSAENAADTIKKAKAMTSRLRLNMTPPFCQVVKPRFTDIKSRRHRRQPWRTPAEPRETEAESHRPLEPTSTPDAAASAGPADPSLRPRGAVCVCRVQRAAGGPRHPAEHEPDRLALR